jgi:carbamoyltransferase
MIILGVHCGHNSSAALMADGAVVGAVQEERFTKRKNQVAFPAKAIRHLVDAHLAGDAGRIDRVAFATREIDPIGLAISRYSDFSVADHVREMHEYWRPVFYEGRPNDGAYWVEMFSRGERLNHDHNVDVDRLLKLPLADAISQLSVAERPALMERLFGWTGASEIVDHHSCHAHYALYGADVRRHRPQDILVLTADSWGDGQNWSAYEVDAGSALTKIGGGAEHGVARIYRFVTLLLGMKPNEHEYKIMGLSAYSRSRRHIAETEAVFFDALDFQNGRFVRRKPLKDSYFDLRDRLEGHRFDNIAAAIQNWATAVTRAWVAHWLSVTGKTVLCFSGGLSMNIKMNGELTGIEAIRDFSVPASGGDESVSIGACFASAKQSDGPVVPMKHVYLGTMHDEPRDGWREGIAGAGAQPSDFAVREGVAAPQLAKLLAGNCIVARCVGPMEFGARALGNRSILADPSKAENLKKINDAIKNRDFWMPFTPSILAERAADYLEIPKGIVSPYMTIGYESTPRARTEIIAALHPGDFSARPQFVQRESNPDYWQLISEFEKLTQIGALLNTSLNLHGDPMNSTVVDAARTLALSELDFLAMPGDRLLYKCRAGEALSALLGS